ncbi:MAG TPA: suppressor of fused domain protein [Jatrophihabitantaceae bacterium]
MSGDDTQSDIAESVRAALVGHFGDQPSSASVSFVGVEPIEVLRFRSGDSLVFVTLGMSRRPMPVPGDDLDVTTTAAGGPRGELMMSVSARDPASAEVWRRLAVLAAAPAVEGLRYADGAIVSFGEPLTPGTRLTGVVVGETDLAISTSGGPVTVFELHPAMPDELAWARVHGVPALRARWHAQGLDLTDLGRRPVDLR